MAVYFQQNEIGVKETGVTANVPNNDVAHLMYYLGCVCGAIQYDQEAEIQRFTNYRNWSYLSIDEQKVLLTLCHTLRPDVLNDKVFFHSEVLCGDNSNQFLEISQVRHQLVAAQSIMIAGRTLEVNKIMVYKMQWMRNNYFTPMQNLAARLRSLQLPPIAHYPAPQTVQTRPLMYIQHRPPPRGCSRCAKICIIIWVVIVLIVIIFSTIGFVLSSKTK